MQQMSNNWFEKKISVEWCSEFQTSFLISIYIPFFIIGSKVHLVTNLRFEVLKNILKKQALLRFIF